MQLKNLELLWNERPSLDLAQYLVPMFFKVARESEKLCNISAEYWVKYNDELWELPVGVHNKENTNVIALREALDELKRWRIKK